MPNETIHFYDNPPCKRKQKQPTAKHTECARQRYVHLKLVPSSLPDDTDYDSQQAQHERYHLAKRTFSVFLGGDRDHSSHHHERKGREIGELAQLAMRPVVEFVHSETSS